MPGRTVVIVGGGPGGLFLARLLRMRDPRGRVIVYERNPPDATFGFGVVFSERTLTGFAEADAATHDRIVAASRTANDMEMRYEGATMRFKGFGFTAIARTTLLKILQEHAAEVGAELCFGREVGLDVGAGADVVVAGDGANSSIRQQLETELGYSEQVGSAKYAWFGTAAPFDAVTFPFVHTPHGEFAAHVYPYGDGKATFVAEVDTEAWRRAGMEESAAACEEPGASDEYSRAYLEDAFAEHLQGAPLLVNNSKWANFRVVRNERWHHGNVVLLGDAAHTAHFSVGSGTKMAMEDAIALASALAGAGDLETSLTAYERERRPAVGRTQTWAAPSQRWWESFARRRRTAPAEFGFHYLTRTRAISYAGFVRRDPDTVVAAERAFLEAAGRGGTVPPGARMRHSALATPLRLSGRTAPNRLMFAGAAGSGATYSRAGAGIVLVGDGCRPDQVKEHGALAGALVPAGDVAAVESACAAGFDLIELTGDTSDDALRAHLAAAGDRPVMCAWSVAHVDPWSAAGDERVRHAAHLAELGVTGVRLEPAHGEFNGDGEIALPGLGLADRIRTETGLTVALTVRTGWALDAPATNGVDEWLTQAHVALVTGRLDLVATWPLVPRDAAAPATWRPPVNEEIRQLVIEDMSR